MTLQLNTICCLSKVLKKERREEQEKVVIVLKCMLMFHVQGLDSRGITSFVALDICKEVIVSQKDLSKL